MKRLLVGSILFLSLAGLQAQNESKNPADDFKQYGVELPPYLNLPPSTSDNKALRELQRMKDAERLEEMYKDQEVLIKKSMESQRRIEESVRSKNDTSEELRRAIAAPYASDRELDKQLSKEIGRNLPQNTSLRRYDVPLDEVYKPSEDGKTLIPKNKREDNSINNNGLITISILLVVVAFFYFKSKRK